MLGLALMLAFLVFNPVVMGLVGYVSGGLWPAVLSLGALLLYTAIVVPLGLIHEQSYCPGHPDCPDLSGFAAALGGAWLLAGCIAATVGGILGDDRPKAPAAEQQRLFVGRGRRRRRPLTDVH